MAAIDVNSVSVRYGDVVALEETSLKVDYGRVCAIVGMNGSGKSTLFKSIMGLVAPEAGSVLVAGQYPQEARKRGEIAYVPQNEAVDWEFPVSVRDVVMMGRYGQLGPSRRPKAQDRRAVEQALERVGLADLADRQIGRLSGGQRKRAFVARGIVGNARILLLDEPFAGVDKSTEATITGLLRDLAHEGAAVIVITHDLAALASLADEAVLLRNRVLMHSTPQEVLQPENIVRAFGVDVLPRGGAA